MSSTPLDCLPYVDGEISSAERAAAELLIDAELAASPPPKQDSSLDPAFESLLLQEVRRYEESHSKNTEVQTILPQVIDMQRYHEFPETPDYQAMYTALSYAALRERSSRIQLQNVAETAEKAKILNADLGDVAQSQKAEMSLKREALEEVYTQRAFKQQKFAPVQSHLEHAWKNGVRSLVDHALSDQHSSRP